MRRSVDSHNPVQGIDGTRASAHFFRTFFAKKRAVSPATQVRTVEEFLDSLVRMARNPSPISPSDPVSPYTPSDPSGISSISGSGHSGPTSPAGQDDDLYLQESCACTWCASHPAPQIRMDQKAQNSKTQNPKARKSASGKARQALQSRKSGKDTQDPEGEQDTNTKATKRRRAVQRSDEYTVRSFLDARYMFAEDVDPDRAILPAGKLTRSGSLTHALHVKIDWDGVDTANNPYKPTWEVADSTTLEGSAWRAFVSKKRALTGNKDWSVADIPFKRNARPGKHMIR